MSENNPYQAPSASLIGTEETAGLGAPRTVSAGQGANWIGIGFKLFGRGWLLWILAGIAAFVLTVITSMIPLVGAFIQMVVITILCGGCMVASQVLDRGDDARFGDFFSGFSIAPGPLALLGLLYMGGNILAMLAAFLVGMLTGLGTGVLSALSDDPAMMMSNMSGPILIMALVYLAVLVPMAMAYWFAPALITLNRIPVFQAIALSFQACLKNIVPFLVFGLIGLVLLILGALPAGLGLLVVMPVLFASTYVAYKDIFQIA